MAEHLREMTLWYKVSASQMAKRLGNQAINQKVAGSILGREN